MSDRYRVLVADDDAEIRETLADYLVEHQCDVAQAVNGLETLLHVKRERPQAVLLDINMPRLGGLEALKRIRAVAPGTRVVVYSGFIEPEIEREAVAAGAVAVFRKPAVLDDVHRALRGATAGDAPTVTRVPDAVGVRAGADHRESRRLRILLIDDDPGVSETLAELLASHGADTFPVANAVDALRLLVQGAPDAIFLDVSMPGLSGVDALPSIRALAPDAKVVMVSGIDAEDVVKQALARGAFDYIVKPVDPTHLQRTLETIRAMTAHGL